ncbi:hypothetical protein [Bacillus pumilus]
MTNDTSRNAYDPKQWCKIFPPQSKEAQTKNIVTTIAKKLAVQALRKSGTYLEKTLSKVIGKKYAKKVKSGFYKVAQFLYKLAYHLM